MNNISQQKNASSSPNEEQITPDEMSDKENTDDQNSQEQDEPMIEIQPLEEIEDGVQIKKDSQEETSTVDNPEKKAEMILRLDQLIKGYLVDIKKMKEKMREQKEIVNNSFQNDAEYQEVDKQVRELNKKKLDIKQRILNQKENVHMREEMASINDEIKEAQTALSDYLKEYERLTQATEFETDDGELFQILHDVKLKKR